MNNLLNTTLKKLQKVYSLVIIINPLDKEDKRYFILGNFTPAQNQIIEHTIKGKEITELLENNSLSLLMGNSFQVELDILSRQNLQTKLDELEVSSYKFSAHYLWEWWLSN